MRLTCLTVAFAMGLVLMMGSVSTPEAAPPKPELTGKQILEQMATAYEKCKTYHDSGTVTTKFIKPEGPGHTNNLRFKTAFVRPDRFRFEYHDLSQPNRSQYIIWSHGKDMQSYWAVRPDVEKGKSLGLAIAGAAGVSSLSSQRISTLLMSEEVGGTRLTHLTGVSRLEDAKIGDVACYRIQGLFGKSPIEVWIEKDSLLVRRIEESRMFEGLMTETVTTYDAAFDKEISEKLLKFNPPQ